GFRTPLPDDVAIRTPAAEVPAEFAAYSGAWTGKWVGGRAHTLIVEGIEGRSARLVYSWGAGGRNSEQPDPGFRRVIAEVGDDGSLRAAMQNGATVVYRLSPDHRSLSGEWLRNQRRFEGVFQRRE